MNILITGGASGLGEAITTLLAKNSDVKIYFTYSNSVKKAEEIQRSFVNAIAIKCDFRIESDVRELTSKINSLDLDVLVNNAYGGYFLKSYFHKTDSSDFLSEFKENIIPTIEITQAALSTFRKKKSGKIITVLTSAIISNPPIGASVYCANKAYLQQLVKAWATENVKFNITSNSVSPSFMITAMTSSIDERLIEQMKESHPLKKLLTPLEVAETINFLLNASPQINGTDFLINSGATIR